MTFRREPPTCPCAVRKSTTNGRNSLCARGRPILQGRCTQGLGTRRKVSRVSGTAEKLRAWQLTVRTEYLGEVATPASKPRTTVESIRNMRCLTSATKETGKPRSATKTYHAHGHLSCDTCRKVRDISEFVAGGSR